MRLIELTEDVTGHRVLVNVTKIDLIYTDQEVNKVCIKVNDKEFYVQESEHEILVKIRG